MKIARLRKISIKAKFIFIIVAITGLLAILGALLVVYPNRISDSFAELQLEQEKMSLAQELIKNNTDLTNSVQLFILSKDIDLERQHKELSKNISDTISVLRASAKTDEDTALIDEFQTIRDRLTGTELLILFKVKNDQSQEASDLFDQNYFDSQIQTIQIAQDLAKNSQQAVNELILSNKQIITQTQRSFILIVSLASLFLFGFLGVVLTGIVRQLSDLGQTAKSIAAGQLAKRASVEAHTEIDELAQSFNFMADTILDRSKQVVEEKARLEAAINSLNIGFIIADINKTVIVANKAVNTILNLVDQGATVANLKKALSDNVDIDSLWQKSIDTKRTSEKTDIHINNKYIRLIFTPIVVPHDQNKIIGQVIIIEDQTKAKMLEISKDDFIALASHELRTPLTAIRGNAEMIADMVPSEGELKDANEMAIDIINSTTLLTGIVHDFLDVTRLEQDRTTFNLSSFDIVSLIKNSVETLKPAAQVKNLELSFTGDTTYKQTVYGDKEKIIQVLSNLIDNAINYTREGSIEVFYKKTISNVTIFVKDTGVGISEQNQQRLFVKFEQAGESILTRDVTHGTGLGLYIATMYMHGMNGSIQLEESQLGKGSTFSFTIPISASKS